MVESEVVKMEVECPETEEAAAKAQAMAEAKWVVIKAVVVTAAVPSAAAVTKGPAQAGAVQ